MRNLALRIALPAVVAVATIVALAVAPVAPVAPVAAADKAAASYVVPKPLERSLKNQMKIYLIEDHSIPRVHFRFVVRAGSAHEPAEKAGLANMTFAVMRQGTEEKDAKALSEAIDFANGRILNPRFSRYRVPRFSDTPVLETVLVDRKDLPSAGAGETPIVGIAPAVGNAIFAATGQRLRSLPMLPSGRLETPATSARRATSR